MDVGLILSDKYKDFMRHRAQVEVLEGTTSAGKTTVGIVKFMLKVAESPKKYHIVAAADIGTAEKNFINKELGITDNFGKLVDYKGNGTKDEKIPHIEFVTSKDRKKTKIIYVMGYGDKVKWKKALGGQYGCLYIDEANTADIEFVRESVMRADYTMMTLNPDDPGLPVYKEFINCCRPVPKYRDDAPLAINNMLTEPAKPDWTHWFFSFEHNAALTEEKKQKIILSVPKGTKLYKNKIEGLRGKATGLVFGLFDRKRHVISKDDAKKFIDGIEEYFMYFTAGLDTSYSQISPDTIAMSYAGITNKGRYILLNEKVYSNVELDIPLAPSDTVRNFVDFLNRNQKEWGLGRQTFVDSADQATQTEFDKYKRMHPECIYVFNDAYKKLTNVDRINLQLGWMSYDDEHGKEPCFFIVSDCTEYISEMELYSWDPKKDNQPEDGHDHMIQSAQYGWIPYKEDIGRKEDDKK